MQIGWTSSSSGESGKYIQNYSQNPEPSRRVGDDTYRKSVYVKIYIKEEFLWCGVFIRLTVEFRDWLSCHDNKRRGIS
jgi:hypothetical protein